MKRRSEELRKVEELRDVQRLAILTYPERVFSSEGGRFKRFCDSGYKNMVFTAFTNPTNPVNVSLERLPAQTPFCWSPETRMWHHNSTDRSLCVDQAVATLLRQQWLTFVLCLHSKGDNISVSVDTMLIVKHFLLGEPRKKTKKT
jgi:hypothetical protein